MKAVLQRVDHASVTINNEVHDEIGKGLLIFLGITQLDTQEDIEYLVKKILNMRIFSDGKGKMNLSLLDTIGEVLVISQFTLYASTKKGNRPSFINAARPDIAIPLYERFKKELEKTYYSDVDNSAFAKANFKTSPIKSGVFGADMKISLINDGPVTILIDSKNK
ncbi:D-tyrosyl-tRNA(Tyr) deacylase [Nonlabens tegetincola]|uniref:D-aminoacyl-tRNA deacylase n=1 Tax=Nonlabens tegetincola TaxID=323273 RepID=UPI000A203208|nr:D-aminoacyl-tRNA deacylase [Nonlabens tegetincola]ARN71926.1 D-tyrosyl-tRNA(Tyr) deacylase [Nonlabens tegetincola]